MNNKEANFIKVWTPESGNLVHANQLCYNYVIMKLLPFERLIFLLSFGSSFMNFRD